MFKIITPLRVFIFLNLIDFFSFGKFLEQVKTEEISCFNYKLYIQILYRPYYLSPMVLFITFFLTAFHYLILIFIKKKYPSLNMKPLFVVLWFSIPVFLSLTGCIHEPYVNNCELIK